MYFEVKLLCRGGKFATIWIAANSGLRALSNRDVKSVSIELTCEELMKYIASNSLRPSHRFSLPLSSKLIHGLCIIHRKQVDDVYNDVLKMMATLPKTLAAPEDDDDEWEDIPEAKPKKRTQKKKKSVHSDDPDLLLYNLPEQIQNMLESFGEELASRVFSPAAITMKEVDERVAEQPPEPEEHMDMGKMENFQFIEELLKAMDIAKAGAEASAVEKVPTPIEEVIQVAGPVEQVPEAPVVQNVPEIVETNSPPKFDVACGPLFNTEKKSKKPKNSKSDIWIKLSNKKKVFIDQLEDDSCEYEPIHELLEYAYNLDTSKTFFFEEESWMISPPTSPKRTVVTESAAGKSIASMGRTKKAGPSSLQSLDTMPAQASTSIASMGRTKKAGPSSLHSLDTMPAQASTSKQAMGFEFASTLKVTSTVDETLMPPPQTPLQDTTPYKAPIDRQIEQLEKQIRKDLRLDEEVPTDDAEQLQAIIHQVIEAKRKGEMPLRLEQVAQKPLTKRSVIGAFGRLLTLHGLQYVELVSEENSTELSHINLGTKLKDL